MLRPKKQLTIVLHTFNKNTQLGVQIIFSRINRLIKSKPHK